MRNRREARLPSAPCRCSRASPCGYRAHAGRQSRRCVGVARNRQVPSHGCRPKRGCSQLLGEARMDRARRHPSSSRTRVIRCSERITNAALAKGAEECALRAQIYLMPLPVSSALSGPRPPSMPWIVRTSLTIRTRRYPGAYPTNWSRSGCLRRSVREILFVGACSRIPIHGARSGRRPGPADERRASPDSRRSGHQAAKARGGHPLGRKPGQCHDKIRDLSAVQGRHGVYPDGFDADVLFCNHHDVVQFGQRRNYEVRYGVSDLPTANATGPTGDRRDRKPFRLGVSGRSVD